MANGHHHDTGMCWEWDSVLLLSNPCSLPTPSLEADGSSTGGLREHLSSTPLSSLDHGHFHRDTLRRNETSSNNHGHTDSRSSETQHKDSKGGDKKRDPRLDCPNFLAGRVPCACTDNDDDDSGVSRKRSKPVPRCQVAACGAELTDLKGYHQRHRVCLRCAHATRVILRDQPHRYCQQCGKFHPICDFDEGKRSCRRKLEKHNNRRRRKAGEDCLPASDYGDTETLNESSPGDGAKADVLSEGEVKDCVEKPSFEVEDTLQTPGISSEKKLILKVSETPVLSQMSTDIPSQTLEPTVATVVKENLPTVEHTMKNTEASQHVELQFAQEQPSSLAEQVPVTGESLQQSIQVMGPNDFSLHGSPHQDTGVRIRRENDEESLLALLMDENGTTDGSHFSASNDEHLVLNPTQLWESSPSPGELSKEVAYSSPLPTGRISFKLYDWNPGDFPRQLRQQVMEWLSNMPVDLEGYIRSGCTILTIFIAMPQLVWEELNADWARSVLKLVKAEQSLPRFWSSGYLIARMDDHEVHINNGDLARPFSQKICESPILDSVRPLCLEAGSDEEVGILGRNFQQLQSRLLVSFEGKYIVNDAYQSRLQGKKEGAVTRVHDANNEDEMLFVSMPALPSTSSGTAYIEVEHISGTSNYIPLLVAEKNIADEVRSLEKELDRPTSCCNPNLDGGPGFPHLSHRRAHSLLMDLGWILKNAYLNNFELDLRAEILEFHLVRLRRLLFFGVKRRWYNVVEKVLQLSSRAGLLEKIGILENGLSALQVAVLHDNQVMVEHLMSCAESLCPSSSQCKSWWNLGFSGPEGLTALHIVALQPGAHGLCDTLLKKTAGASMWNHIQDHLGHTPQEYSTRQKLSHGIDMRGLTIQTEGNSWADTSVNSNDFLNVRCKDCSMQGYAPRLQQGNKDETRISLPSLPYRPWKVTRKATGGVTHRRLSGTFQFSGHQGLTMYISSGRKRGYELLSCVTILLVCAGLCVMVQSPNQVMMFSLSLQRCLFGLENGSQ